tara:strand:+ start:1604 stop:1759 length:156 start_codon:yes stop_codon:yes gene_type:complete
MSPSQWFMALACLLFVIGGIVTFFESKNWRVAVAMIFIGLANALLLWEASA